MIVDRDQVAAALPGYRIGERLGAGAFGLVLAGRHRRLKRPVAIKILPGGSEYAPGSFETEARLLAGMDHPHIVRVFDYVEADDLLLIVMELLDGGTLTRRRATLDPQGACAVGLAVAAGLSHAHIRGVLHLDIKPGNLLFDAAGTLKVADFGIAKMFEGTAVTATAVAGTPSYMAPEQITGGRLSPATDLYALGVVIYQLLTGALPFDPTLPVRALFQQHLTAAPPPLTGVPAPIAQVVLRALAKDPTDRQPTAQAFALDLARAATAIHGAGWTSRVWLPLHLDDLVSNAADQPPEPASLPPPPPLATQPSAPGASTPRPDAPSSRDPDPGGRTNPRSRRRRITIALAVALAVAIPTVLVVLLNRPDPAPESVRPTLVAILPEPAATPRAESFSADGHTLVVTTDSTVRMWNITDPANASFLGGFRDFAKSVGRVSILSPDGRILAHSGVTTDGQRAIFLWDVTRPGSPVSIQTDTFTGESGGDNGKFVRGMAFSPDGLRLVAVGGNEIMSWDLAHPTYSPSDATISTGAAAANLHESVAVGLSADGRNAATADLDNQATVRIWDTQHMEHLVNTVTFPTRGGKARSVLFLDTDTVVVTDDVGTVTLWDTADRANPATIAFPDGGTGPVDEVLLSFDRHTLVTFAWGRGEIQRWDVSDRLHPHRTATLRSDIGAVSPKTMAISTDGRLFSAVDPGKDAVNLWTPG
ncbi:WD40 repeat domain-containing serine/threonine protein kinase [Frankia sp. AvcI1]|uniref:WD40 repeat domain-containing serine/threonine protein kinase n=2 Tax=Frankia sp. AvcI1 TaxID=573496 RepID=UPI002117863A|nr:serine/threonine-protein kinase [Frankia sp. AvcI1]